MHLGSLTVEEYEDFGPVQHFRDNFIAGWNAVLAAIADARTKAPGHLIPVVRRAGGSRMFTKPCGNVAASILTTIRMVF